MPSGERLVTYAAALNEALREEMERDEAVVVLGEDVSRWGEEGGVFGVTGGLARTFGPQRVRDTPISEEAIVSIGVGAAVTGLRPVVELMYFDFVTLAMDPLVNQAAKLRYMFGGQASVPLVLRSSVGASGGKAAQHSQSLESWLVHVPGLKVVVPSTPSDAKGLLKSAIRDPDPVVFLEHKLLYFERGPVPEGEHTLALGEARVVRPGRDVTVVATHAMVREAMEAADALAAEGVELEVIDPRTLVPLDLDTIVHSVARTHRLVICHEAVERGGWAAEVAMQVVETAFDELDAPIARVCGANVPVPYAESLERVVIPDRGSIASAVRRLLGLEAAAAAAPRRQTAPSAAASPAGPDGVSLVVPRLSDTMESATIGAWLLEEGAVVAAGDELVEVETDKVTVTLQAETEGLLASVLVRSGEVVPPGTVLATIRPR